MSSKKHSKAATAAGTKPEASEALEKAGDVFGEIADLAISLRNLTIEAIGGGDQTGALMVGARVLAEKIGWMADAASRTITKTELGGACGSYAAWIGREELEDEPKQGAA